MGMLLVCSVLPSDSYVCTREGAAEYCQNSTHESYLNSINYNNLITISGKVLLGGLDTIHALTRGH